MQTIMKPIYSFAFIFMQILVFVNASGFYSIIAPEVIRSHQNYSVSVSLHENSVPSTIKVGIEGPSYNETKSVEILPSNTEVLNFEIPYLQDGYYTLESEGIKGLIFKKSAALNFQTRDEPKYNIYIQTDKAIYKSGDLVQYRIIVLDKETKPPKFEQPAGLVIKDAAGNSVQQINGIKFIKGVNTGEYQLSDEPILGAWKIEVNLGSKVAAKSEKKFEVAKYVLPKFSIDIETARDIFYGDPIRITIRAKYTYGKPVKGQATIKIDNGIGLSEKVIDVDGIGHVEFHSTYDSTEMFMARGNEPKINVLAVMTEKYTGNKQNKTAVITSHSARHKIQITGNELVYSAKKPFEIKAFVKNLDGSPVQDNMHSVRFQIVPGYSHHDTEELFVFTSKLDKNGMALFTLSLPHWLPMYSGIVEYKDSARHVSIVGLREHELQNYSEDVGHLNLIKKTEKPQVGEDVVVEVKSNRSIPYYVYAIVAHGDIIKQEYVTLPENVKSHEIKFKSSFKMVPKSHLYVYFVLDGDFISKEITLNFPKDLPNKIEITAPKQVKPGEEVTLNIKTAPDSFVGLLGVDQSVLMLQSGNDLNPDEIINNINTTRFEPYILSYKDYPGKSSGLVTLTNANYPYSPASLPRFGIFYNSHVNHMNLMAAPIPDVDKLKQSFVPEVRKIFTESWIFDNINNTDANGLATFTKNIPDTITSWAVTGFSSNEKTGFGMVAKPTNIEVFQPFFVSTYLPYSVKRGEVISIPIIVHNYMDTALDAEVVMENTDAEYDFAEISNEIEELVSEDRQKIKKISVPSNSGKAVSFIIRPNKVGDLTLRIKATTPLAGDAIQKTLTVEPEGITQYKKHAKFISSLASEPIKEILKADIPSEVVLDSEYFEFSVSENILSPTIKNIDKLVRKPTGSGEQNIINFVPNILVLHYLDVIKYEMPAVVEKAKLFAQLGYQRQLIYKHQNGAYSNFGMRRSEPSNWLTAYVARSFILAKRYIAIDQAVIDDAVKFLLTLQLESGKFEDIGRSFRSANRNVVGFTAYALLTLLEDKDYSSKYKSEIDKGLNYIEENIEEEGDIYALAIAMLVLRKAQHPRADKLMERLEKLAHEENGLKWWIKPQNVYFCDLDLLDRGYAHDKKIRSNTNEGTTAYILQAYTYSESTEKLLPIVKWLIEKSNNLGGFDSTQDTVLALEALIRFAEKQAGEINNVMTIKFEAQDSQGKETTKGQFTVDKDNLLIVQTHVLPKSSRQINLETEGGGTSLVYLSYHYNLATKDNQTSFSIKHTVLKTSHSNLLKMNVCAEYVLQADEDIKESNMAIMKIFLPSGFIADKDKLDNLLQNKKVQRIDTKNADTAIIIYIDYLTAGEELCLEVNAEKTHAVAKQKPAAITIYDYYNSDKRAIVYYEVKSSLCDICEEGECGKGCEKTEINNV